MFTTFYYGHYQPLAWLTLGFDFLLWGMNPRGYHLSNLVLHAANAVLVFLLARRLLLLSNRREPVVGSPAIDVGAGVAALLFAIHPLRVESVAWVTDRNDLLSATFLLISVLSYLRYADPRPPRRPGFYWAAVAAHLLSLLARASGVVFPIVLLVLDLYPLGRLRDGRFWGRDVRRVWLEKIPYFVFSTAAAVLAPIAKKHAGSVIGLAYHGIGERIAQACYGLVFYLYKTLLPIDLSPVYELRFRFAVFTPKYVISGILVLGAILTLTLLRRRVPALVAAAICYVVLLLPVLGFVQSGLQEVADRYSYLPTIGWAVLLGSFASSQWRKARPVAVAAPTVFLAAILGFLSWRQCFVWRDSLTLWRYAVEHGPPSGVTRFSYANELVKIGERDAAIVQYRKSLEILPWYRDTHHHLSNCLEEMGRYEEAIAGYQRVLQLDGTFADAYFEMGYCYEQLNRVEDAIDAYRHAIRLDRTSIKSYIRLGGILVDQKKQFTDAIDLYRQAIAIGPGHRDLHFVLGLALEAAGKPDEALSEYHETLRLDPTYFNAHVAVGNILAHQGRKDEAAHEYREALRIAPNDPTAKENLDLLMNPKKP